MLGNALAPATAGSLARRLRRDGGNAAQLLHDDMAKANEIAAQYPRLQARIESDLTVSARAGPGSRRSEGNPHGQLEPVTCDGGDVGRQPARYRLRRHQVAIV